MYAQVFIVFGVVILITLEAYRTALQSLMSLGTLGLTGFTTTILLAGVYLILHLQACMNHCDLIKTFLRRPNSRFEDAADSIRETKCTKNIDIEQLMKILEPAHVSLSRAGE